MTTPPQKPTQMVLHYFILLFFISIALVGRLLWPFLSILILSFFLAGIFQPIFTFINKKFSPSFSAMLTCILVVILVFVPLMFFVGALSSEAFHIYKLGKGANLALMLKDFLANNEQMIRFREILEGFGVNIEPANIGKIVSDSAAKAGLFLFNQASSWAANVMHFVFNFFLMIITIFFLLLDHEKLTSFLLRLSPLPDDQERQLINKFKEITGAVLVGNGICGLIQGVLGGIAFVFFDLGSPIIWGGVMVILAFLPIFGIGLVLIPAAFILLAQGNPGYAIFMLIFYAALSFSVEYALKPKLVGRKVKMHTLLVFLAILGGLNIFGFLGIIYGPLIISGFLTMSEIYLKNYNMFVTSTRD